MEARVSLRIPATRRDDCVDSSGGVVFSDPYRWLEPDTAETLAWDQEQNARTTEYLVQNVPGRDHLARRIAAEAPRLAVFAPRRHGGRWFNLRVDDQHGLTVQVGSSPSEPGDVVLAASRDWPGSKLDWYYPSPDGEHIAFGISYAGDEQSVLRVIETDTGNVVLDAVPHVSALVVPQQVAWFPDSRGFCYAAGTVADTERFERFLFIYELGQQTAPDPEPLSFATPYVLPQVSADGRFLAALADACEPRPHYVKDLRGSGPWKPFLKDLPGAAFGVFRADTYIAISTLDAPRGRLVEIPLTSPLDVATWREIVPESDAVLRSVQLAGDLLVLGEFVDVATRIRLVDLDGRQRGQVPLPGRGAATYLNNAHVVGPGPAFATPDELTFVYQDFVTSPAAYRYDIASGSLERLGEPPARLDHIEVENHVCHSADGTPVHMFVVGRADLDGPAPTMITGYGGGNVAMLPAYLGALRPFVEAGGRYVLANLRGGGEFGWDWWSAGSGRTKKNGYDDLFAVAEFVGATGIADPERLAMVGRSNGGLLAGVALTLRPDLWRVIVPAVPFFDLMRSTKDAFLKTGTQQEIGDPHDPELAPYLLTYSPYHNVAPGVAYPPCFVLAGRNDIRCLPWHSRKFVAQLQAHSTADDHILLRIYDGVGHAAGADLPDRNAEWLGFLMTHLGLRWE